MEYSKGMMVVTGSESPIVVVLGGSMEPAFTNYEEEEIMVGEIVVFKPSSNILAAGTAAQQLDTSYSTNSNLEIYGHDMPCLASLHMEQRFHEVHRALAGWQGVPHQWG